MKVLRLILGDQLNSQHSWFSNIDQNIIYVLMEIRQETDYVRHHIQKILIFFAAMRQFAQELQNQGHRVHYVTISNPENTHSLVKNLENLILLYVRHKNEEIKSNFRRIYRIVRNELCHMKWVSYGIDIKGLISN
jgi:deoxyribodipyrimidine photolyase-related protein